MNHIYRLVWSSAQNAWVVCSELTKAHKKSASVGSGAHSRTLRKSVIAVAVLSAVSGGALAADNELPTGGQILSGAGDISQSGNQLNIQQQSHVLDTQWNSFNVGSDASVRFQQPDSSAVAINRIQDNNPSNIRGRLEANGQVFLQNPNGILFGEKASINAGGLIATTQSITAAGQDRFALTGDSNGMVSNAGQINVTEGGTIALIAPQVDNSGSLTAPRGNVRLTAAEDVTLQLNDGTLANYSVNKGVLSGLVDNSGSISANGGVIHLNAKARDGISKAVVNHSGTIEANTISRNEKGEIILLGDMQHGSTNVSGSIRAEGQGNLDGGFIETSAAKINITDSAKISTQSEQGQSGQWLIDPVDIHIAPASDPDSNITGSAVEAALQANDTVLISSVATGACVGVAAGMTCPGLPTAAGNGDIFVKDDITWNKGNLVFQAERSNIIDGQLTGTGTAQLALLSGVDGTNVFNKIPVLPAGPNLFIDHVPYIMVHELGQQGDENFTNKYTLQGLAHKDNKNANFILVKNIDATDTVNWNGGEGFKPIGSKNDPYAAVFEGYGHTISNLHINRPSEEYVGLFGSTQGATIQNLTLEGANIVGEKYVGGVIGRQSGGSIQKTTVQNSQIAMQKEYGGGMVGRSEENASIVSSKVANVELSGQVKGKYLGGVVGRADDISMDQVTVDHLMMDKDEISYIGGLIGRAKKADVRNSSVTTSTVSGEWHNKVVGGAIGQADRTKLVSVTADNVEVQGEYSVGGLVGEMEDSSIEKGVVSGTPDVHAWRDLGGLVGMAKDSTIEGSSSDAALEQYGVHSTSGATSSASLSGEVGRAGGLVGHQVKGKIINSHATGTITGESLMLGGLVGLQENGTISDSYATGEVKRESISGGAIKAHGASGGLVGIQSGRDALIESSYATGKVDVAAAQTGILSVGLEAGGLVGVQRGGATIRDSYATGDVGNAAIADVGGLVGLQDAGISNTIENSYATGQVLARENAGGLVGTQKSGMIKDSYSTSAVGGGSPLGIGGVVGAQFADGKVEDSVWKNDNAAISGVPVMAQSGCGTSANADCATQAAGKTTAQLDDKDTFAGWGDSWVLDQGTPKLKGVKGTANAHVIPSTTPPSGGSTSGGHTSGGGGSTGGHTGGGGTGSGGTTTTTTTTTADSGSTTTTESTNSNQGHHGGNTVTDQNALGRLCFVGQHGAAPKCINL